MGFPFCFLNRSMVIFWSFCYRVLNFFLSFPAFVVLVSLKFFTFVSFFEGHSF